EQSMPSPGGQISGMADTSVKSGRESGVGGHPVDLLEGYHTPARGQSQMTHTPVLLRAAPGCRVVGLRQIDGMPHRPPACKIDSSGRRRAVGRREALRNREK
ncbi:MAG: hypothetical protein LC808_42135, partial [Actinobacteria bacterium]|nr:hypothetical protein [Actinomycetota bacterium]